MLGWYIWGGTEYPTLINVFMGYRSNTMKVKGVVKIPDSVSPGVGGVKVRSVGR